MQPFSGEVEHDCGPVDTSEACDWKSVQNNGFGLPGAAAEVEDAGAATPVLLDDFRKNVELLCLQYVRRLRIPYADEGGVMPLVG